MGGNEKPMTREIRTVERRCLRCGKSFASEWIGNRVCFACNRLNATTSQPARCEFLGQSQSEDSITRQVKLTNHETGVE